MKHLHTRISGVGVYGYILHSLWVNHGVGEEPKCRTSKMPMECFRQPNQVRVGYLNDSRIPYVIKREVSRIIPHPDFDYVRAVNDIALIELSHPLACLDLPRPICLPPKNLSKVGNELIIAGWGREKKNEYLEGMFLIMCLSSVICDRVSEVELCSRLALEIRVLFVTDLDQLVRGKDETLAKISHLTTIAKRGH
ncbi:chymotrypsin-like protease CTRL-1 [Trichonephila clavipes]|nr:chymotrypsin-like protease CTRL-1 [Trichonephila clavipes]